MTFVNDAVCVPLVQWNLVVMLRIYEISKEIILPLTRYKIYDIHGQTSIRLNRLVNFSRSDKSRKTNLVEIYA